MGKTLYVSYWQPSCKYRAVLILRKETRGGGVDTMLNQVPASITVSFLGGMLLLQMLLVQFLHKG